MKLDRQKAAARHRLLTLHCCPPTGQTGLQLQTGCCRSDFAGECQRPPKPAAQGSPGRSAASLRNL